MMRRGVAAGTAALLLAVTVLPAAAAAQPAQATPGAAPSALQGFSTNRNDPIKIESGSLELRDKDKQATFIDNVRLVQGDTTLECKRLVVFYDEEPTAAGASSKGKPARSMPNPSGQQSIRRLEAHGGVVVTQKDQTATGDRGIYDMKTNSITLIGNVTVAQGQNVVRGEKLFVDLTTGVSRVESGAGGPSRVQGLFLPNSVKDGNAAVPSAASPAAAARDGKPAGNGAPVATRPAPAAPKDKPATAASKPLKLN
jgi:lipopolysaccharide export system protein LptA